MYDPIGNPADRRRYPILEISPFTDFVSSFPVLRCPMSIAVFPFLIHRFSSILLGNNGAHYKVWANISNGFGSE